MFVFLHRKSLAAEFVSSQSPRLGNQSKLYHITIHKCVHCDHVDPEFPKDPFLFGAHVPCGSAREHRTQARRGSQSPERTVAPPPSVQALGSGANSRPKCVGVPPMRRNQTEAPVFPGSDVSIPGFM